MLFKKRFTTVDIGTDSIKAARFINDSDLMLEGISLKKLPYESIKDGRIIDEAVVAARLAELLEELNGKRDEIVTTIPVNNLIIRKIELPVMGADELAEALKWEAADYLPYPVENAVLDYKIISQERDKLGILLLAVKSDIIASIKSVFRRINLTPSVINIQPMALLSLLDFQNKLDDSTAAVIDIGASGTRIIIGSSKNIFLSRVIAVGGNDFSSTLMEGKNLRYNEAERFKGENGIQLRGEKDLELERLISQAASSGSEAHFLFSAANNLAEEIKRSLDYYQMEYREDVNEVFLTGGSSRLKNLPELITETIGRDLYPLNPFEGIKYKGENNSKLEEFAVTVGLAASEVLAR